MTAITVTDPTRRYAIAALVLLGIANFALIIVTYENTPDVFHFADLVVALPAVAAKAVNGLVDLAENRLFELITAIAVGIGLGVFAPRLYQRRKRRQWLSSYDIFKLADPALMRNAEVAEDEIQHVAERILALGEERKNLGLQPDGSVDIDSRALEILQESMRKASAHNIAAHELRDKTRRKALADIYTKLTEGKLIAKGFKDPLGLNPKETEIEASYWKFLKFTGDYKEAEGKGIKFTGIEVARK